MFRDWENFYLILGSAAAALIGLMFVAAALMAGLDKRRVMRGTRVYFTPIIFHFGVVLVVSAIAVVPELPAPAVSVVVALCAINGCAYSAATMARMLRPESDAPPHWSDKYFYGILPAIAYLGLVGAAGAVWFMPHGAAYAIGAIMLVLLLIGIRDAWDLATYLLQRAGDRTG